MNAAAANALLKTLEEPPPDTYLCWSSHQPGRLLATIAQPLPARRARRVPARDEAIAWLESQGVARRRDRARPGRRRAAARARARRPRLAGRARGRGSRRSRSRSALAAVALASRIDAGAEGRAQGAARGGHRLARRVDRRPRARGRGRRAAAQSRPRTRCRARAAGGEGPAVPLSSFAAARNARWSPIRCSRASSPRRC